jgi:hypothetical protein
MAKDANEREETLVEAQERVRQTALEEAAPTAVAVASSTKHNNKLDSTRLKLTQELQFDTNTNHDYWWNQMPKLLKVKASLINRQQVHIKSFENEQMECVLRGYQELLGDPVPDDESGDLDVMEDAQQQDHKPCKSLPHGNNTTDHERWKTSLSLSLFDGYEHCNRHEESPTSPSSSLLKF